MTFKGFGDALSPSVIFLRISSKFNIFSLFCGKDIISFQSYKSSFTKKSCRNSLVDLIKRGRWEEGAMWDLGLQIADLAKAKGRGQRADGNRIDVRLPALLEKQGVRT
jgi:hypothetical protein